MLGVLIIAAIAAAVVLGYKTKINTGFFCIAFAYIIGCFMLGLKPKELIAMWRMFHAGPQAQGADRHVADQHHVRDHFRFAVL